MTARTSHRASRIEESAAQFAAIALSTSDAIIATDLDGVITAWNPGAEKLLGFSRDEAIGRPISIFAAPDALAEQQANLEIVRAGGMVQDRITRRRRKDGAVIDVSLTVSPVRDEGGRTIGFSGILRDASERTRLMTEIERSRDLYLTMLDDFPAMIWRSNRKGSSNYVNRAWLEFVGAKPDEDYVEAWHRHIHPADRDRVIDTFGEALRTRGDFHVEYRVARPDGEHRVVADGRPYYGVDGAYEGFIGLIYDVTGLRHAEEREQQFVRILESTPDFVGTAAPDGRIRYINSAGREMIGIDEHDLASLRALDVIPARLHRMMLDEMMPTVEREGAWVGESAVKRKDGTEIPISQVVVAHRNAAGEIEYFSTIGRDLTPQRRSEEALRAAEDAARRLADQRRLRRWERRYAGRLQALNEAFLEINKAVTVEATLSAIVDQARTIVGARRGVGSARFADEHDPAAVHCASGPGGDITVVALDDTELVEQIIVERRMAIVSRGSKAPAFRRLIEHATGVVAERGGIMAPLIGPDDVAMGCVVLADRIGGDFTQTDMATLVQLAQMGAAALQKARIFEHEHHVASLLQRSFLPEQLPQQAGAALDARYVAGGPRVQVGGDWYDAVALDGGRLALVMGDVEGHGLRAATAMGHLRNMLRTYAWEGFEPAAALERLNALITRIGDEQFATLLYATLDPVTRELTWSCAGHPPPLLLRNGEPRFLYARSCPPIGALSGTRYSQSTIRLDPGDIIVLYTDGLVESRVRPLEDGLATLASVASEQNAGLGELLDALVDGVPDGSHHDDVAVMAVRLDALLAPLRLSVPPTPESLATLRARLREYFASAGIGDAERDDLVLASSEAVANAIEHSEDPLGRPIEVSAGRRDGEISVEVRDFGRWREPVANGERGRGMRIMRSLTDVEVHHEPDGTRVLLRRPIEDPA